MNEKDLFLSLWYKTLKIRLFEEKIVELYGEKEMRCPVHLSIGQEAVASGVCEALKEEDRVISNHRSHSHYIAKGGDISALLAEIYGKKTGCAGGRGGSMHLMDKKVNFVGATPIVSSTIPIGVGTALSSKMKKEDRISVIFLGDAAIEEGVFHESLNFAALKKLPVLFICENNQYSVYTHISQRQPMNRKISDLMKGYGIESSQHEGNNGKEVYDIVSKAVEKIRTGGGPIFLEFMTYRWREHCGVDYDNHLGYRKEEEFLEWKKKDPVLLLKDLILNKNIANESELESIKEKINGEIEKAVKFAKESPFPDNDSISENIYSQ